MTDQRDTISPRARRRADASAASDRHCQASHGARVLARVPLVTAVSRPASASPPGRRAGENFTAGDESSRSSSFVGSSEPFYRIDAAHFEMAGPHSPGLAWLNGLSNRLARLLGRKSLMVGAVVAGALIGFVVQHGRANRTRVVHNDEAPIRAVHSERKHVRRTATIQSNASNAPASLQPRQDPSRASAASNQPATEADEDMFFRIHDSPAPAAGEAPPAEVNMPSAGSPFGRGQEQFRTAWRDVSGPGASRTEHGGIIPGVARFGGTLDKLPPDHSQ